MKKPRRLEAGTLPLFLPESPWVTPTELPSWALHRPEIALDTETRDDGLRADKGSSWPWKGGEIIGVSVAVADRSIYVPLHHPDTENFPEQQVMGWLAEVIRTAGRVITFAGGYDWGWLSNYGITPPVGKNDDSQIMAVMLDESRRDNTLDTICQELGLLGKNYQLMNEAGAAYGFDKARDVKANLWQLPARFVGPYAEADAIGTLASARLMDAKLTAEGLGPAYRLEADLQPMVVAMRRQGIRIDTDRAQLVLHALRGRRDALLEEIRDQLGWRTYSVDDIRSPGSLEKAFDQEKIGYPRTPKTNRGSFKSGKVGGWMSDHPHWLPKAVARARQLDDFAEKFINTYVLSYSQNDRVHAEIHQLRDEDGGTRTTRFSYSEPPLQQIPERADELAALIRGVFIAEVGETWGCFDYSQQEYRMIVHYAVLMNATKAEMAAKMYRDDPNTDFHKLVVSWTGLDRKQAKDTNFGKSYGAGIPKFASMIKKSEEEARAIYMKYDTELPFVSEISRRLANLAGSRGYIKLLDGARIRFNLWEPVYNKVGFALPFGMAKGQWPNQPLRRAGTHKALNSISQGGCARMTKLAMRECWKEGYLPLLQMHDELDFSLKEKSTADRIVEIMRDTVQLKVPSKVDAEFGSSWGDAKHTWEEATNETR